MSRALDVQSANIVEIQALTRHKVNRDLALLLLAVVAFAMPFLRQPFHMDDNFYMDMARNARVKPLYPNDTPYVFEGNYLPDMASHSHPPFMTYFLALLQRVTGEGQGKEWAYHSGALVFPVLAVWAFYFFSARFVARPLWPSIALACCPLFLVMQHTLMTDVPTLAFWLAAIASFVWASESNRKSLYIVSAVFQFGAMFASYQSIALFPLLGFYHIRRRGKAAGWCALVVPLALMAAWLFISCIHYHRWVLGGTYEYIQSRNSELLHGFVHAVWIKLLATLEYQGWLILFPFFFVYAFGRAFKGRLAALALLASAYITQLAAPQYRLLDKVIFAAGLATGSLVFFRMAWAFLIALGAGRRGISPNKYPDAVSGPDRTDDQFLGLWYFGVSACCIVLFTEGSARYILPLIPPVLLLLFRELEKEEAAEYRISGRPFLSSAMLASGSVVVSLFWGLTLSQADLEFAMVYPRAAREFSRIADGMPSYYGGEWGFRYYMEREGARQMPVDEALVQGGSVVAIPRLALGYQMPADLRSMSMPVQTLTYELTTPVRTLDWQTPAGFYSSAWGLIPFSVSRKSLEMVEIYQVNFLVERLPWARVEHPGTEAPWSGYLSIEGKSPLALLAHQGSRIVYPWTSGRAVDLDLKCGVDPQAYSDGDGAVFEFEIRQCDSRGNVLARYHGLLRPGARKRDRAWQDIQVPLQPSGTPGGTIELEFKGTSEDASAVGAFAEATLRPAR